MHRTLEYQLPGFYCSEINSNIINNGRSVRNNSVGHGKQDTKTKASFYYNTIHTTHVSDTGIKKTKMSISTPKNNLHQSDIAILFLNPSTTTTVHPL